MASQDDSEIEEISDPNRKKGKAKATEYDEDQDHAAARKKGKRKATSDDDDDMQGAERPKRQKTKSGRAGSEIRETARTRTKPSSRAMSKQPIASKASEEKDDKGVEADVTLKNPKKRKINIFPTGNDAIQFSFGGMSNVCFYSSIISLLLFSHVRIA